MMKGTIMKEKENKQIILTLGVAFLAGMIPIIFSLFRGVGWEANDDPAIAWFLSRGNNWSLFQSKILCWFFRVLYRHFGTIEWWAVMTLAVIYASTVVFLYMVYRKRDLFFSIIMSIVLSALVWLVFLRAINFTRTAFIASMAGSVLIVQALYDTSKRRLCMCEVVVGYLFLIYGTMIRRQCGILAVGYLAVIASVYFFKDSFRLNTQWFVRRITKLVIVIAAPVIVFAAIGFNNILLADEQSAYVKYNNYRSTFSDFYAQFPTWDKAEKEYTDLGISYDGYRYFDDLSEDTDMFSTEKLEKLATLKNNKRNVKDIAIELKDVLKNRLYNSWQILYAVLVVEILLVILYGKMIEIVVVADFYMAIVYIINAWISHFYARVFEPIAFGALIACILIVNVENSRKQWKIFSLNGVAVAFLLTSVMGYTTMCQIRERPVINLSSPWSKMIELKERRIEYMDAINADGSRVYLFPLGNAPIWWTSAYGFWEVQPTNYCTNMFCLGGWDARAPYNIERLKSYGIDNPMKALYEKSYVYSTYSPVILEYLQKTYDSEITVCGNSFIKDCLLVQYTTKISDNNIKEISDSICLEIMMNSDEEAFNVSGTITGNYANIQELYCNVTLFGKRYTYRIGLNDDDIYGKMYGATDRDLVKNMTFFGKLSNGEFVEIPYIAK